MDVCDMEADGRASLSSGFSKQKQREVDQTSLCFDYYLSLRYFLLKMTKAVIIVHNNPKVSGGHEAIALCTTIKNAGP
jgi:hypothetical protein